jgi:hypothetical protein
MQSHIDSIFENMKILRIGTIFAILFSITLLVPSGYSQTTETNIDRPGMDYKNFNLPSPDPKLCQNSCQQDTACKAWTYVKPGVQGQYARCWLKSGVPSIVKNSSCISGVIGGQIPPDIKQVTPIRLPAAQGPTFKRDRDTGQIKFGDGAEGKTLPEGDKSIKASSYRAGENTKSQNSAAAAQAQNREANLNKWEKKLVMPPEISSRLSWAHKALAPSGMRKLEQLALPLAPAIAWGTDYARIKKQAEVDSIAAFPGLSGMNALAVASIVMSLAAKDMEDDIRMIMAEIRAMTQAKQKLRDQIRQLNDWISQEMSKAGGKSSDLDNVRTAGAQSSGLVITRPAMPVTVCAAALEKMISPVLHLEYVKTPDIPPLPPRGSGTTVQTLKSLLYDLTGRLDCMNKISEMTSRRLWMTIDRRSKFISPLSQMMKKLSTSQDILVQNIK